MTGRAAADMASSVLAVCSRGRSAVAPRNQTSALMPIVPFGQLPSLDLGEGF